MHIKGYFCKKKMNKKGNFLTLKQQTKIFSIINSDKKSLIFKPENKGIKGKKT